jgi:hypothetical protein
VTICKTWAGSAAAAALALTLGFGAKVGVADGLYINEIYFNPPNPTRADDSHQYIELRGLPCAPLTNTYLVFIEAEEATAGQIENIFDLGAYSMGANGYLTIRQKVHPAPPFAEYAVNPKATNLRNTGTGIGFGSGAGSSIGASNANAEGIETGQIEAGGWTALIVRTDGLPASAPIVGFDVDAGNDGLDLPLQPDGTGFHPGWTVLDSITLFAEENEALAGRAYSPTVFGFEPAQLVTGIEAGAQYTHLNWPELEIEYVARWGNSTGNAANDWHVANLTNNPAAGFTDTGDFRLSAEPHESTNPADWETNQGVPYGTNMTNTLGSPNYPLNLLTPTPGDFDGDGDVDQADYEDQWIPRFACGDLTGSDFLDWQRNLGHTPMSATAAAAVPEPAALWMAATGLMFAVVGRVAPRRCR